jgi:hypothetical protein
MMIYKAIYRDSGNNPSREVTFDAADLTEALKVLCTTQVCPEGSTQVAVEPIETDDRPRPA